MSDAEFLIALLWVSITAYALLGGADFGGGVLDALARGPMAERQRAAIGVAMGPVWEANHVWLIYFITGLFAAFPLAYEAISVVLFLPLVLALVGIVARGAAFAFRGHYDGVGAPRALLGRVFGIASVLTPFFLGTAAGALASAPITIGPEGDFDFPGVVGVWTGSFALVVGLLAVSACAYLAATYLTVEMSRRDEDELTETFRTRALQTGVTTGALSIVALVVASSQAPALYDDLTGTALPLVIVGVAGGIAAMLAQWRRTYRIARGFAALAVTAVLWAWGIGQYPQLVGPDVTVTSASADPAMQSALIYVAAGGMALLVPSLCLLYVMFRRDPEPVAE